MVMSRPTEHELLDAIGDVATQLHPHCPTRISLSELRNCDAWFEDWATQVDVDAFIASYKNYERCECHGRRTDLVGPEDRRFCEDGLAEHDRVMESV
jgi:hypothetical protein